MYRFIVSVFGKLALWVFRVSFSYEAELPKEGAVMVCGKHVSAPDPLFIMTRFSRPISYMAKAELFKFKPFGKLLYAMHAFPVQRGHGDKSSYIKSMQVLENGNMLGIMPEGTRVHSVDNLTLRTGCVNLAVRTGAVIVPFGIYAKDYRVRPFRKTYVRFGAPISIDKLPEEMITKEKLQEITDTVIRPEILRLSQKDYQPKGTLCQTIK